MSKKLVALLASVVLLSACAAQQETAPATVTETATVTVTASALAGDSAGDDDAGEVTPELPTIVDPGTMQGQAPMAKDAAGNDLPDQQTGDADAVDIPSVSADGSVAEVMSSGSVRVGLPDAEQAPVIEIYEDPICPFCSQFESNYGPDIADAVGGGLVSVDFRMLNFLDPTSASGNYSTRAIAAFLTLADIDGQLPGVVFAFHQVMFSSDIQPQEGAPTDLSNIDLSDIARQVGASPAAIDAIAAGSNKDAATRAAASNLDVLREIAARADRGAGTPSVVFDGELVPVAPGWLPQLLD